jgi:hypothetical protein
VPATFGADGAPSKENAVPEPKPLDGGLWKVDAAIRAVCRHKLTREGHDEQKRADADGAGDCEASSRPSLHRSEQLHDEEHVGEQADGKMCIVPETGRNATLCVKPLSTAITVNVT